MSNEPLVSVVIPVFNSENYIADTINSVLNQTYSNLEIIVVDDCSTDNSYNILLDIALHDTRVRVFKNAKNFGGPAQPRNIGLAESKGDFIAFLDADDIWFESKLEIQIETMLLDDYNFTSTSQVNVDDKGMVLSKKSILSKIKNGFFNKNKISDLIVWKYIALSSVVVRKDLLSDGFSEEKDFISVEDYYLWLNLLVKKEVKYMYVDKELLFYRVSNNSLSNGVQKDRHRVKSLLAELKFILESRRYDLLIYVVRGLLLEYFVSMKNKS